MARSHGRELWFDTDLGDEYQIIDGHTTSTQSLTNLLNPFKNYFVSRFS